MTNGNINTIKKYAGISRGRSFSPLGFKSSCGEYMVNPLDVESSL